MTLARLKAPLLGAAAIAALFLALDGLHYLGVAHGAAQAVAQTAPVSSGVDWQGWFAIVVSAALVVSLALHKSHNTKLNALGDDLDEVLGLVKEIRPGIATVAAAAPTPAPKAAGVVSGTVGILIAALLVSSSTGCGASARETTIRTSVAAADGIRDTFLAYDGPHELELARSGPATPEGKAAAAAALAAYQAKRSATIDKAMIVVYRAIAVAATLNDQPSLDGIKSALDQLNAAYQALKGTP